MNASPGLLVVAMALLGLLVGPLVRTIWPQRGRSRGLLDGLTLTLVAGICILHLIPHVFRDGGPVALVALAVGVLAPRLLHRAGEASSSNEDGGRAESSLGGTAIIFGLVALHAALDGAALAVGGHHGGGHHHEAHEHAQPLAWAIVAHRLPAGLAIFAAARRASPWAGKRALAFAWGAVLALVLASAVGFGAGHELSERLPAGWNEILEGFVAGILLHVVFTPHDEEQPTAEHELEAAQPFPWRASIGALMGIGLLVLMGSPDEHHGSHTELGSLGATFLALCLEAAPVLLVGYFLAGLLSAAAPPPTGEVQGTLRQALSGVVFGLRQPVCSCSVMTLYRRLLRQGVPLAAALAFFVATPVLGLDTLALSIPLLGGSLALTRLLSAVFVALVVGVGLARIPLNAPGPGSLPPSAISSGFRKRIGQALRFGFVDLFDHTMPWVLTGLAIAAFAEPLLRHGQLQSLPAGIQVPVAALVAVPLSVCASVATPIAALAVHQGLSAGAALAFLVAGPITNVGAYRFLAQIHGRRAALVFMACVSGIAMAVGWLTNLAGLNAANILHAEAHQGHDHGPIAWLGLGLIALLCLASLFRQGPRGVLQQIFPHEEHAS